MQAPGQSRPMPRRSPGADPGPPPNVPARAISPAVGTTNNGGAPRPSTSSSRPSTSGGSTKRGNSGNAAVPLSQIEKSVTHLLVATKSLLETLTQWSRREATDGQVSDVYVRLGYEFNMACRAFTAINVDTSDLGNVPELLRNILEATLSQEASAESLERYLPKIRDIIINLLHGLKRKQQRLRQRQARERDGGSSNGSGDANTPNRTTSVSTTASANSGLTTLLDEGLDNGYRPDLQREDSKAALVNSSPNKRAPSQRDKSQGSLVSEPSSLSSTTMQNMPVVPPYRDEEGMIIPSPFPGGMGNLDNIAPPPPPPPPTQMEQSALAALQRGGDLERRASRRYSAYHIGKHLGTTGSVPMLPPAQVGPIPNRGGGRNEARESMRAMQRRESVLHSRIPSTQARNIGSSPVRVPSRVTEEPDNTTVETPQSVGSKTAPTPRDKHPQPSAMQYGSPEDFIPIMGTHEAKATTKSQRRPPPELSTARAASQEVTQPGSFMLENSPTQPKELTLFLQYKSKVKKVVLPEGYSELTIGRLQLAFIEKFSWNTQQNGADLPDIYIQDPVSGVRHELEELSDIKDRTVLVLNVEPLDEVKRHFDDGLGSIKKMMQEMKQNVHEQGASLQRVSERQQETAKDVARLAAAPPPVTTPPVGSPRSAGSMSMRKVGAGSVSELHSLRRDLAVLRQTYSNFQSEVEGSMTALREKAANVKLTAAKMSVPDVDGDTGHAYVAKGRKQLNVDSDRLVAQVDDLQDLVEDLRKDVVTRGVRPLPRQLEDVSKDITLLAKELTKMGDYLKREKPIWTKIWEKELEDVCQGRDELRLMEDLMVDLQDDLEKATETFALVEEATKEQMKDMGVNGSGAGGPLGLLGLQGPSGLGTGRAFSKGAASRLNAHLGSNAGIDPSTAKEGVLGEVRALQPNHENRLEAIERAKKLRQKELESRAGNALTKEISNFVEEGKLKKSGGFEEVERARKAKDDRIRREVWERMNGIVPAGAEQSGDKEAGAVESGGPEAVEGQALPV